MLSSGAKNALLGAAMITLGCAHRSESESASEIEKLRFDGTKGLSQGKLKDGIVTTATGWWWPFAERHYYDPFTWQTDLGRISKIYEASGFFSARVVGQEAKPSGKGVELSATIDEGQPTRIESVEVRGLDELPAPKRKRLIAELPLREGRVFLESQWEFAKDLIREHMRNWGYAQVEVAGQAVVHVERSVASLVIDVHVGPPCAFGAIEVRNGPMPRFPAVLIWEQVRLAIPEGSPFSDLALAEAQKRLFAMGVFLVAKVTVGPADPNAVVPIVADVREAPLHTLRIGAGMKIDQIRDEARMLFDWSNSDFLGGMRKLSLHAEAGWAFIPNVYAVARQDVAAGARNGPIARVALTFEQPRFLGHPLLREKSTLEVERTLEQAYDALGSRLGTGVVWRPWSSLSLYTTYNLQAYYLNGPAIASVSAAPLALGCTSQSINCFLWLSYLEETLTWDKRDSPLEAHNGAFVSLALQEGGGPLGGDFTYLRVLPDVRGYITLGHGKVPTLAARLRVGELIHTGSESAVVTRFFAGGGVSMRGFSDRRLSPLLLAPGPTTSATTPVTLSLPIGGNGMVEGNVEVRFPLSTNLVLAAFLDFGQVTQGLLGSSDLSSVLWATGFGLRYRTVVGPIRVDLARRLQFGRPPPLYVIDPTTGVVTQESYAVADDCFGIGGSGRSTPVTDGLCVLHIAIGEDF
jgi:translocation and assembly module TamA